MVLDKSQELSALMQQATEVVAHLDAASAAEILKQLEQAISQLSQEEKQTVDSSEKMQTLWMQLRLVAFPELSEEETANVVQKYLFEFFIYDIPFEDRLMMRYVSVGYHAKNETRGVIKKAILENEQKLGPLSVGEWLKAFDQTYNVKTRTEDDIPHFITQISQAMQLRPEELGVLKKIIHVYETLLALPIVDIYDLAAMDQALAAQERGPQARSGQSPQLASFPENFDQLRRTPADSGSPAAGRKDPLQAVPPVQLPLLDALGKFPRLNDQTITQNRITVKSERDPVRPSVRNWLRAYRDVLGVRAHTAVERGQFLFHSANGRALTEQDREKLSLLLKALDENTPLTIDPNTQEVIFYDFSGAPGSVLNSNTALSGKRVSTNPSTSEGIKSASPTNFQAVRFSSKHTLPSEKANLFSGKSSGSGVNSVGEEPSQAYSGQYTPRAVPPRIIPSSLRPSSPERGVKREMPDEALGRIINLRSPDEEE